MDDIAIRTTDERRSMDGWSLVLTALAIPHLVQDRRFESAGARFVLLVAQKDVEKARASLDTSDREEAETAAAPVVTTPDHGRPFAPLVVALVLGLVFLLAGERFGRSIWFAAGSSDAEAIVVGGQWWRAFTALTLHADVMHLFGNVVAGMIFLSAVGRWLGGGTAALLALLGGGIGNLATALHHGSAHVSVGASTGTFAALGVLGGLQSLHRARFGAVPRPSTDRIGRLRRGMVVIAACLGLFAMTGTGSGNVDVAAHAYGLGAGFLIGLLVTFLPPIGRFWDLLMGALALGGLAAAWAWARVVFLRQ
ncbi:MAG: rhomboid family intramembrane serine protease [Deltaproteobacteria bacterium]|nr:rhomboid family intramembrane serine protease [Deltaproteobacteria bacterium]